MQTLVPIGTFEEKARKLLGKAGFDDLLEMLARRPRAGTVIRGTGGLRKVRFARTGKGKSGGTRVIYFYQDNSKPILLLLIYAKADQDDLTDAQKAQLKKHVNAIIDEFSQEANDGQKTFRRTQCQPERGSKGCQKYEGAEVRLCRFEAG